jgi:SET domain
MNAEFVDSVHSYIFALQSSWCGLEVVSPSLAGPFSGLRVKTTAMDVLREGQVLCEYVGIVMTTVEAMRCADKSYLMRLGEQAYIDARPCPHILARYINDCINPAGHNVRFDKQPKEGRALVVATRDIYPGEEIFVDYGKWYWLSVSPPPTRLSFKTIHEHRESSREKHQPRQVHTS